ncbi:GntR family transcriptional regulator [Rhodopseudomonas palustris]|uniref:GntR family transcriptional regulator n=1 Tax=Rhodopseudomonas palustris TaxID=1076 RepID=A0A418VDD4_RHOPL|nr:GntR family transcriptional regulator [Rhodopseudomonas palustris]RJF74142.1 GntR family transcriptional regulator [Rhodopseudomonas palustris]
MDRSSTTARDGHSERRFAPRTLPDQVAEELGADIVSGRRKAGARLVELDLAQEFGVSRGPIREAIRILERRRLVELLPRRGAYIKPVSLKSVADLFNVRTALSALAVRTMATSPVESYIDTLARRCDELKAQVDLDDPMGFARTTTRAVKTIARGSGNELLVELLTDLANQTVWTMIWKSPLDYQTRDIRLMSANLMTSTLKAIRQRKPNAAETHFRQLLEGDRDRALATLSEIRGEAFDFSALDHADAAGGALQLRTARPA